MARQIEPIRWTKYIGEVVTKNVTIRKGKKIFDKDFYQDKANVVPDGLAFCIGNGPSRKGFTLEALRARGQTYACNAIYRDFIPDFIFSVDAQMTQEMVRAEVYKKCIHYAPSLEVGRHPNWRDSVLHLIPRNPAWISGNVSFWTAAIHGHKKIYLIGYDFREYGKDQLNNIYQDTKNYGERNGDMIFDGWLRQFREMIKMYPYIQFTVVHDNPPEFLHNLQTGTDLGNTRVISYNEFKSECNLPM